MVIDLSRRVSGRTVPHLCVRWCPECDERRAIAQRGMKAGAALDSSG